MFTSWFWLVAFLTANLSLQLYLSYGTSWKKENGNMLYITIKTSDLYIYGGNLSLCFCILGHFGPNISLSGPFDAMAGQKKQRCKQDVWVAFWFIASKTFALSRKKLGYLAQKRQFLPQKNAVFVILWSNIGLAGSFDALLAGCLLVVACGLLLR